MITRRQALQGGGLLAASLLLAACGSGARPGLRAPGQGAGHNDINPMPRDRVRDGGELRWTLDAIPDNFNAESKGNAVGQNYGRIFSPQITALFEQDLAELDDNKRAAIGNQADQLIWQEVHHLPLYPSTGAYAVRATLANFGAPGFADIDYIKAGFAK